MQGHRERIPAKWPQELQELITDCWAQDPVDRPSFDKVCKSMVSASVCSLSRCEYACQSEMGTPAGGTTADPIC